MSGLIKPHITQYYRKNDSSVDFKYICIKKECFDVNMIDLVYKDVKKNRHIELLYKSPSAYLEGIFLKTPNIKSEYITIIHKESTNNINIKILLNYEEHNQFIKLLRNIDDYICSYLNSNSFDIRSEMLKDEDTKNPQQMYKYEPLFRFKNAGNNIEITMKSYLDKHKISDLEMKSSNKNYVFTFNISNIYFGISSLISLIKCNRCEISKNI
jgi:hypothetical protein